MRGSEHTIIGHCLENVAKKTALFFDGVSIVTDHIRAEELHSDLDSLRPEFVTIIWLQGKTPGRFTPTNSTLWATAIGSSGRGIICVPVYGAESELNAEFKDREHQIYRVLLDNIPIIDDAKLSWEHVAEIRQDKDLLKGFRALRLWINAVDSNTSVQQFRDILGKRIDDYHDSLKRHGISTVNGSLTSLTNPAKIATLSAVVFGANLTGGALLSALSGGLLIGAEAIAKVTDYLVGRKQLQNSYAEVAVLQDIATAANTR